MDFFILLCDSFTHMFYTMLQSIYNDGGRAAAYNETKDFVKFGAPDVRDCVTRALAIITGRPYAWIWQELADINRIEGGRCSANHGVYTQRPGYRKFSEALGFMYVPLHDCPMLKDFVLPTGKAILNVTGHSVALIDGVLYDTHHCSPAGKRRVRGYWVQRPAATVMYNVCNPTTRAAINRAPLNFQQAETMAYLMHRNYQTQTQIIPI